MRRPPAEIRIAIELLDAQRIGHGTTLLHDPAILDLVLERQITIEACPTSNVHTGVIRSLEEHPLRAWIRAGVRACLCTDNTFFSEVISSREHREMAEAAALDPDTLAQVIAFGHHAAFPAH